MHFRTVVSSGQKGIYKTTSLTNSETWILTAVKLPHDISVCQKKQVIWLGIFKQAVGEKHDFLDSDNNEITD